MIEYVTGLLRLQEFPIETEYHLACKVAMYRRRRIFFSGSQRLILRASPPESTTMWWK
jgi:hypothetical protein